MSEQFMVMGKVNKGMSKKKESAWLGRWTQLGNEVEFQDSKELIRAEDNVKERRCGDKEVEVLPFPMFKVSQKRDNTTKDDVGSSSKAMAVNNRMPWMYAQGDNNNVQEKTTQNLLELMRPVRFYATVDSVQRVSGEPEEGSKVSMKLKGKIFGGYLDLFPNVDHHQQKGGVRLESLESSKDTQEGKNESSAETDTLEMDKLQMMHLSGSIASSSTKGGRKGNSAFPRTEIPDMNEEPPLVLDTENSETSNSATQSMNVDHFLSRDCKRVRLEQEPEASSRWVKRLKRNSFDSSGDDETKSLMKVEEEGNINNNNLFLEILKSGINNLQPRNREPDTPQIKGGEEDITLQHPWIQRWCKKKDVSTDQPEGEDGSFEPENQKEKKQYPSIAAMALMGKALSGLNPYGLRKTDSLMVWNARDLR
ncbi:hypothetical protein Bca4012_009374 [Brassica carinata]|uniref:F-box protein n=1 Tax=Brassica carinata TaxID=52824 RepID=A0A8X7V105_BRACI|nr:hypothetical protein Bca52824_034641 [Brassica carinata]